MTNEKKNKTISKSNDPSPKEKVIILLAEMIKKYGDIVLQKLEKN